MYRHCVALWQKFAAVVSPAGLYTLRYRPVCQRLCEVVLLAEELANADAVEQLSPCDGWGARRPWQFVAGKSRLYSVDVGNGVECVGMAFRYSANTPSHCGSEPAREEARPVDIDLECQIAFASKLAPAGDGCHTAIGLSSLNAAPLSPRTKLNAPRTHSSSCSFPRPPPTGASLEKQASGP